MSGVVVALLVVGYAVYLVLLRKWWPVLDDPDYFIRLKMEEDDNDRFFASLPKPNREWNT